MVFPIHDEGGKLVAYASWTRFWLTAWPPIHEGVIVSSNGGRANAIPLVTMTGFIWELAFRGFVAMECVPSKDAMATLAEVRRMI
jgi:hypothetical protein